MINEPTFGTDGVRGVANYQLTAQLALKLGVASAHVLGQHSKERHVVVGRDTRLSGEMLEAALNAGLASMGALVTNIGVVPTPAVSQVTRISGAIAGVVISASHNPYEDNGIKFFGSDGKKLSDAVEAEISAAMKKYDTLPKPHGTEIGRISYHRMWVDQYAEQVRATARGRLDGIKVIMDCANGAACDIAPNIFRSLGADVQAFFTSPDGVNINRKCGSTELDAIKSFKSLYPGQVALAFDGDCDRVLMIDENGNTVDGDAMMAILAIGMKERGELTNDCVVATIMSNAGLEVALNDHGIKLLRTPVGDRYVAERMLSEGAKLGGEQSGHILLPDLTPTGDGMVTAIRVLREMLITGKSLAELSAILQPYPQLLEKVKTIDKTTWETVPEVQNEIQSCKELMTNPDWLSVRASGTENVLRIMVQDKDSAQVESIMDRLLTVIKKHCAEPSTKA